MRIAGVRGNGGDDDFVRAVAEKLLPDKRPGRGAPIRNSGWLQKHQQRIKNEVSATTAVGATAKAVTAAKVVATANVASAANGVTAAKVVVTAENAIGASREVRRSIATQNRTKWTPREL